MVKIDLDLPYTENILVVKDFSYTKNMAARTGRPKIPKGKQKKPFPIRFTRDDIASFIRAARQKKVTVNEWVTSTLTAAAKRT